MRLRNPFRKKLVLKANAVGEGHQVVSCPHEHWQSWRNTILAETTTCGNFDCAAHRGTTYLEGRQCITPGCGVTWRIDFNGKPPRIQWRERGAKGTENGGPPAPARVSMPDRRG